MNNDKERNKLAAADKASKPAAPGGASKPKPDIRWDILHNCLPVTEVSKIAYAYINSNIQAYVVQYSNEISFVYTDEKQVIRHVKEEGLVLFESKYIQLHHFGYTYFQEQDRKGLETSKGYSVLTTGQKPLIFAIHNDDQVVSRHDDESAILYMNEHDVARGIIEPVSRTSPHMQKDFVLEKTNIERTNNPFISVLETMRMIHPQPVQPASKVYYDYYAWRDSLAGMNQSMYRLMGQRTYGFMTKGYHYELQHTIERQQRSQHSCMSRLRHVVSPWDDFLRFYVAKRKRDDSSQPIFCTITSHGCFQTVRFTGVKRSRKWQGGIR